MKRGTPKSSEWRTPDWLYRPLHQVFAFRLDAAANARNRKCDLWLSPREDALRQPWAERSVWCNPPYGDTPDTSAWVAHGRRQAEKHQNVVAMLLPVKAETAWYQDLVWGNCCVWTARKLLGGPLAGRWFLLEEDFGFVAIGELRGRVGFADARGKEAGSGWFASAVVVYGLDPRHWDRLLEVRA